MSRRNARRAAPEGLHIHLISGDVVRMRRFEGLRVLTHRQIVAIHLLVWIVLALADPSGQSGATPFSVRLPQYGTGLMTTFICFFAVFAGSDWLLARRRVVVVYDWPFVLTISMLGLVVSETTVALLTGEVRITAKVFFVLSVFYFVIIEVTFLIIGWLLMPRILRDLRGTGGAGADEAEEGPPVLRAGGLVIVPETIQHIAAQGNYVAIVTDGAQFEVPGPFSALIAQMPDGLGMRVHRSHWVARRAVTGHRRKAREMLIDLAYGGVATVAIPRHAEVLDWLARTAREEPDPPRPESDPVR